MLSTVSEGRAKTILVTSTIPKEGKTLFLLILLQPLRYSKKKYCLLVWILEIQSAYLDIPERGLTNYLASKI
jgi:hypothetical protein